MLKLLDLRDRPTAVFCYNDMTALGAMTAIRSRGFRIPRDMSVVGFDDLFFAQYTDPPLTTIRQPMREMGHKAVETVVALIAGSASTHNIKASGELILRRSTAALKEDSKCKSCSALK